MPWLKDNYGRPIITVTVDTGGIDAAGAKTLAERALALGAIEHHQVDARADYFEQVLRFLDHGQRAPRRSSIRCASAPSASCRRRPSR